MCQFSKVIILISFITILFLLYSKDRKFLPGFILINSARSDLHRKPVKPVYSLLRVEYQLGIYNKSSEVNFILFSCRLE